LFGVKGRRWIIVKQIVLSREKVIIKKLMKRCRLQSLQTTWSHINKMIGTENHQNDTILCRFGNYQITWRIMNIFYVITELIGLLKKLFSVSFVGITKH
jgi:hypothetical protein